MYLNERNSAHYTGSASVADLVVAGSIGGTQSVA
jgi:hypothetical protein